ncbi:MAG: phosphatidylserine decarboxylase [Coxiella sp. RIFCSPHIGHO2_12_FULL_42_15]|nr:MAG: phosphatidylserine decarboxylase [Coxiella sp. RIFCSPHIGHO2_12_FULL_42_15]
MKQSSVGWQYVLPQRSLSRLMGCLAQCRYPRFKNWAIKTFCRRYGVNLAESEIQDIHHFEHFTDFFIRKLKADARPIAKDLNAIISPVDGIVSEVGFIEEQQIFQAKGKYYTLQSLFGGDGALTEMFYDGNFMTAYLAPKDYHRIHIPCDGRLVMMRYVPGKLFSVNELSVAKIDALFARNERVVCVFDSAEGPFAVIAVGAMVVGSIVTVWHGVVNDQHRGNITTWDYQGKNIQFKKGDELGYFQLGSTVIILFPKNRMDWNPECHRGSSLKLGQPIAIQKKDT